MSTGEFESIITPDGHKRILNLTPSDEGKVRMFAGPVGDVIPRSKLQAFDAWPEEVGTKDQDGRGACNGHAAASSAEFSRAIQGLGYVPLSAWWVYGSLVKGWDRGSNIMDALLLCRQGVAPESTVKYGDFSGRYSDEASAASKRFRIEIGSAVGQDFDAICSEVAKRRALNLAVRATAGWSSGNLDADGCPPEPAFGPCNHAVMVGGGLKKLANGEWAVRMLNSWGTRWGLNGFCWLRRGHIEKTSWFEAYSIRAVNEDPQDAAPPAR